MMKPVNRGTKRLLPVLGIATATTMALSACAGSAGGGQEGDGQGFEYGASQEAVDEALAELDPVELTFQPSSASPNSVMAPAGTVFAEAVEERSGGKITLDVVWGQAIAGYDEVIDALADGRVDIAYTLPIYDPSEYEAFNAIATATAGLPSSPMVGELVANAVVTELAWDSEQVIEKYEENGVTPLNPISASGGYYSVCADPGSSTEDWNGRQVRIASTAHSTLVENLGGSPVSMEYTETFEALQRGTVDCTLGQLVPSAEAGLLEVAPNISYTTEHSISRAPGAYLAGSGFQALPLAYKQVIFDAYIELYAGGMQAVIDGSADAVKQAKAAGGTIEQFDEETSQTIADTSDELLQQVADTGLVGEDIKQRLQDSVDKWMKKAEELGYEDGGSFEDMDEWYEAGGVDFGPMGKAVYEESVIDHRPS